MAALPSALESVACVEQPCSASLVGKHQPRQPVKHERGIRSPFQYGHWCKAYSWERFSRRVPVTPILRDPSTEQQRRMYPWQDSITD